MHPMDKFHSLEVLNGSATVVLLLVAALSIFFLSIRAFRNPESAVNYEVPAPKQCSETWKWEEIQTISLKVAHHSPLANRARNSIH